MAWGHSAMHVGFIKLVHVAPSVFPFRFLQLVVRALQENISITLTFILDSPSSQPFPGQIQVPAFH